MKKPQLVNLKNKSFTMSLRQQHYDQLISLMKEYNSKSPIGRSVSSVQELIRLIIKTYLYNSENREKVRERIVGFFEVNFILGECPNCKLILDCTDFPVLVQRGENWKCHVCGATGLINDLGCLDEGREISSVLRDVSGATTRSE